LPRCFDAEAVLPDYRQREAIGGAETILVVEDDLAVQGTAIAMLNELGYQVLKADNAESALVVLRTGLHIDLLFTDVVMPGSLRSPELAKKAKQLHPDISVLFTSGYTQNAIVHGGRLDAGVELLSKPYRRVDLARKIRHILANKEQVRQLANSKAEPRSSVSQLSVEKKILVVEDNEDACEMLCELLNVLGYEATSAFSAEDALRHLDSHHYLITDIKLPGMSGSDLAKRAHSVNPNLKIIFASGGDTPDNIGFKVSVLPKPYSLLSLEALLKRLADEAKAMGSIDSSN
jgi:CheY-like chemotaxis protein